MSAKRLYQDRIVIMSGPIISTDSDRRNTAQCQGPMINTDQSQDSIEGDEVVSVKYIPLPYSSIQHLGKNNRKQRMDIYIKKQLLAFMKNPEQSTLEVCAGVHKIERIRVRNMCTDFRLKNQECRQGPGRDNVQIIFWKENTDSSIIAKLIPTIEVTGVDIITERTPQFEGSYNEIVPRDNLIKYKPLPYRTISHLHKNAKKDYFTPILKNSCQNS